MYQRTQDDDLIKASGTRVGICCVWFGFNGRVLTASVRTPESSKQEEGRQAKGMAEGTTDSPATQGEPYIETSEDVLRRKEETKAAKDAQMRKLQGLFSFATRRPQQAACVADVHHTVPDAAAALGDPKQADADPQVAPAVTGQQPQQPTVSQRTGLPTLSGTNFVVSNPVLG